MGKKKKKKEMEESQEKQTTEHLQEENTMLKEEQDKGSDTEHDEHCDKADDLILQQKAQIEELNDRFLRTLAEFDNYRKRTIKERSELIQNASADMILTLLPVLDDFDRAVTAFDNSTDLGALREGIVLVQQKLRNLLGQKGLEEMKSIGEAFDTDLHEAVAQVAAEKDEDRNKVMDEIQKGYLLNGKVLRFAKVVVAN